MTHTGGCHCGKIAFEVDGDIEQLMDCNCSICSKKGYLHWFVKPDQLRLKTPESNLAIYTFKSGTLKHRFCPTCGCAPLIFGPTAIAVNTRCLEGLDLSKIAVKKINGRSF